MLRLTKKSIPSSYVSILGKGIGPTAVEVTGSSSLRQLEMDLLFIPDPLSNDTAESMGVMISTTQQSVVADALVNTGATWDLAVPNAQTTTHGVSPYGRQGEVHTIKADYYQPYIVANCVRDTIEGKDDPRSISFPVTAPVGYNPVPINLSNTIHYIEGVPVIDYPTVLRADFFNFGGSPINYRTSWIELPPTYFNVHLLQCPLTSMYPALAPLLCF